MSLKVAHNFAQLVFLRGYGEYQLLQISIASLYISGWDEQERREHFEVEGEIGVAAVH